MSLFHSLKIYAAIFCALIVVLVGFISQRAQAEFSYNDIDLPRVQAIFLSDQHHHKLLVVELKLAASDEAHQQGLMHIKELPAYKGMLFTWKTSIKRHFWMKNTYIPLDIIFINNGVVTQISEGKPLNISRVSSENTVDAVVELSVGMAQKYNIKVGDKFTFRKLGQ